jgi:hypothetical protein
VAEKVFARGRSSWTSSTASSADAAIAGVPDLNSRLSSVIPPKGNLSTGDDIKGLGDTIGAYLTAVANSNEEAIGDMKRAIVTKLDSLTVDARR